MVPDCKGRAQLLCGPRAPLQPPGEQVSFSPGDKERALCLGGKGPKGRDAETPGPADDSEGSVPTCSALNHRTYAFLLLP